KQINERMASDKAWESRILEFQKSLDEERDKRLQAETAVKDLRAQMQTLSDHIGRVLREKELTEKEFADWDRQRKELHGTLHKKDEMITMLSATFQNLLKKPQ
ncbi:MAG: hypothetical protein V3S11_02545, partial [Elusimicrobiota bacterium]